MIRTKNLKFSNYKGRSWKLANCICHITTCLYGSFKSKVYRMRITALFDNFDVCSLDVDIENEVEATLHYAIVEDHEYCACTSYVDKQL